jgi:hypothetical protein
MSSYFPLHHPNLLRDIGFVLPLVVKSLPWAVVL